METTPTSEVWVVSTWSRQEIAKLATICFVDMILEEGRGRERGERERRRT